MGRPYRGQCSNRFLDLRQDHVTVDVPGSTLVQHLAPETKDTRGSDGTEPPATVPHQLGPGSPALTCLHGGVPGIHRLQDLPDSLLQPAHGGGFLPEEV